MIRRALLILASLALAAGCASAPPPPGPVVETPRAWTKLRAPQMATVIEVVVPDDEASVEAARVVFETFDRVDALMSEWKETSPLSAVNRAAGGPGVPVPRELRALVRRGLALGEQTGGAFDITWAALWGLWDFKAEAPRVPSDEAIAARLPRVGYRDVVVDDAAGTVALKREGMLLGLGGIAKGYALERAAAGLRAKGVGDFLISAGGQILASGTRDGRPWKVGIRDPRGPRGSFFATVVARDVSVSTSGDYERFFEVDGVRYHHILDPRTGRPARGLRSATVIAADAVDADALSTALMVMDRDQALALVARLPGVEAVLVDDAGRVHQSAGTAAIVHVQRPPTP